MPQPDSVLRGPALPKPSTGAGREDKNPQKGMRQWKELGRPRLTPPQALGMPIERIVCLAMDSPEAGRVLRNRPDAVRPRAACRAVWSHLTRWDLHREPTTDRLACSRDPIQKGGAQLALNKRYSREDERSMDRPADVRSGAEVRNTFQPATAISRAR
jgi:hypothetical protein